MSFAGYAQHYPHTYQNTVFTWTISLKTCMWIHVYMTHHDYNHRWYILVELARMSESQNMCIIVISLHQISIRCLSDVHRPVVPVSRSSNYPALLQVLAIKQTTSRFTFFIGMFPIQQSWIACNWKDSRAFSYPVRRLCGIRYASQSG